MKLHIQYLDSEWDAYVDLEDIGMLKDKSRLKCTTSVNQDDQQASSSSVHDPPSIMPLAPATAQPTHHPSTGGGLDSWPTVFSISEEFISPQVKTALCRKDDLGKPKLRHVRGLFLSAVVESAKQFTNYPDMLQKQQMAKAIVRQWPHLKEKWGRGYDGWLSCLVNKLKNSRRHLTPKRKHTSTASDDDNGMDSPKRSRMTPQNLQTIVVNEEDETSLQQIRETMQEEMKKPETLQDKSNLSNLLERTFPHRRQALHDGASLESIRTNYVALMTVDGFLKEYELMTNQRNIRREINKNIIVYGRKILLFAQDNLEKRTSSGKILPPVMRKVRDILNTMELSASEQDCFKDSAKNQTYHESIAGMLLLPVLLEGNEGHIFRAYPVS